METVSCIFGHGFSDDIVIEENGYQGRRCPQCRLIYVSPRPERSEVFDLYHHDKAHLSAAHHIHFNPVGELAAKAHFSAICKAYADQNNGQRPRSVLEIGCGGGQMLKLAKNAGLEAFGVELNPAQAAYIEKNLGIQCETKPFSRTTFGDRKFDIIFHCDVTSHLHDPVADFKAMHDKLEPNGQMVFETGNGADISPKYYKYFNCWQYPDHLFFFGEQSIRELLTLSGFTRINMVSWSILPELMMNRMVHRKGRRDVSAQNESSPAVRGAPQHPGRKAKVLKLGMAHFRHFLRFRIGGLASNKELPRTILISAMK